MLQIVHKESKLFENFTIHGKYYYKYLVNILRGYGYSFYKYNKILAEYQMS